MCYIAERFKTHANINMNTIVLYFACVVSLPLDKAFAQSKYYFKHCQLFCYPIHRMSFVIVYLFSSNTTTNNTITILHIPIDDFIIT